MGRLEEPDLLSRGGWISGRSWVGREGICWWGDEGTAAVQAVCFSAAFESRDSDCHFPSMEAGGDAERWALKRQKLSRSVP